MKKIDFKELSADQKECLAYALGDFLNNYNFRERADELLRDIENIIIHGQNVGQMQNLSDIAQELSMVCDEAARFWNRYAENELKEFAEYEEKDNEQS